MPPPIGQNVWGHYSMRPEKIAKCLAASPWANWTRRTITGDASARRYERLHGPDGNSVILMDADPATCGSQKPFAQIACYLHELGLKAPEIWLHDDDLGLLILSDLGTTDFSKHLRNRPDDEITLYDAACKVLSRIKNSAPPNGLTTMTPEVGADMVDIAFDWAAQDRSQALKADIKENLLNLLTQIDTKPTLSLRDFHAENLIWNGAEQGTDRVGLLDFQDAFLAHPVYDLVSLLRDARRDVSPELMAPLLQQVLPDMTQDDANRAFHVIAVQRNLRILGIFNRLAHRDGKPGYLNLIPRVWSHLRTDLNSPHLRTLVKPVMQAFAPDQEPTL